jgi:hypothetical protein
LYEALRVCWWPNVASLEKLYHPVSYSGLSGFSNFRVKPRKELTLKIWKSNVFWSIKRGYNASRDQDERKPSMKSKS